MPIMLKVVVDTSVFVAGLLTKRPAYSPSAQILQGWREGRFSLVMSPQIMRELVAKVYEKGVPEEEIVSLVKLIGQVALRIPGSYEATKLDDVDPDDNIFLAAAYESGADYIVSGDKKHILPLKHFHGSQILSPELFLRTLMGLSSGELKEEQEEAELNEELKSLREETWSRRKKQNGLSTEAEKNV